MSALIFTSLPNVGGHTTITLGLVPILQDGYGKVTVVAKEMPGHGTSMEAVAQLRQLGAEVICLSGKESFFQLAAVLLHWRNGKSRADCLFFAMGMRHLSPLLALLAGAGASCYYHITHELTPGTLRRLRSYLRFFHQLVFISPATQHDFAAIGKPSTRTSWAVQPSDLDVVETRAVRGLGCRRFGFVGRLSEAKGSRVLLEFARRESLHCELHVAGSGEYEDEFRALSATPASPSGVSVSYWGSFSPADRRAFYSRFFENVDYLIVPSQDEWEGIPTVILEALQFGVPVIATDAGGLRGFRMEELGAVDCSLIRLIEKTEVIPCLKALAAEPPPKTDIAERCKSYYGQYFGRAVVKTRWHTILRAA